ncbi:MAG TPA: MMPL family transporter [Tepidiformaceae bacterium]|nr:MMPL family transporter [Tepidiformaceae bacterium]
MVIIGWIAILAATIGSSVAWGAAMSNEFTIPASEAQEAVDMLEERFPSQAGDSADIVFLANDGIADPGVQGRIEGLLADIAELEGVVGVDSPYEDDALIAEGGRIARAEVHWSTPASEADHEKVNEMLAMVDESNGEGLRVEAGGQIVIAAEQQEPGSEAIGLLAAIVILFIAFGSIVAMGLPIAAALFGLGAGFAGINLGANILDFPDFTPAFAAMIGIGVGIDYSLLVITRFRESLHAGKTVESAVVTAVTTAGRSVIFAGVVVAIAFLGLFAMGIPFITAIGIGAAIVVVMAVLIAVTLTPALLSLLGHRVDALRVPFLHSSEGVDPESLWYRFSRAIQKHPLPYAIGGVAVLLLLASPVLSMRLGFTDAGNSPESMYQRRAYDLLEEGFGPGFNGPLLLVADITNSSIEELEAARAAIADTENVVSVTPALVNGAGDTAIFSVVPGTSPQDEETTTLVHTLREEVVPAATNGTEATILVGGATAGFSDIGDRITERLPYLLIAVIGLSFILLMAVFRSVVVALKAAILNLLSIGAAYGVVVAVFQLGWGASLIGVDKGPVETFLPMMMFAVLFGLSMDYEVFLISRIREEYLKVGDNSTAVANGLAATARVITAAAAIMVAVFLAFVLGDERVIKEFGIGLATAIFVDATIVRLVLVPSTMELLGEANWWMPKWLDRVIPRINVEGTPEEHDAIAVASSAAS